MTGGDLARIGSLICAGIKHDDDSINVVSFNFFTLIIFYEVEFFLTGCFKAYIAYHLSFSYRTRGFLTLFSYHRIDVLPFS